MSNRPKTQHCPQCHGTGLEETAIGGRSCRKCLGKGRVLVENPARAADPGQQVEQLTALR